MKAKLKKSFSHQIISMYACVCVCGVQARNVWYFYDMYGDDDLAIARYEIPNITAISI